MKISVIASTKEDYIAPKEDFDKFSGHSAGICYMSSNFNDIKNEPMEDTIRRCENTKARV